MPTGYTAGILDGEIKSFKQFATTCMRAFGATIHMRDEKMSAKYEPRTPSKYYAEHLKEAKDALEINKNLSDAEIIKNLKKSLLGEEKHYEKYINEKYEGNLKLNTILSDVNKWVPPTKEHMEFKNFMKLQLVDTISHDGDVSYYVELLTEVQGKLFEIQDKTKHPEIAEKYRKEFIKAAEKDIEYYTKELNEEMERCNNSNKWVEDLLKSIK
jgi:hypothetical protein